ncbi:unnamed protein product [Aureobasidium vineae]|uniref:Ubiquitin-like protease family profile domain-containing protein n=1 Tax=Aureobasidium vineae TaxID=2773715 RepID=A0A9N8JXC0_9PEZI|nr:unnamed protein product [Aureobasidium vineae]
MSKRKLGSQSPTNLSLQQKKTRVVPDSELHRWTAPGFDYMVYTPTTSPLPSPFAVDSLDEDMKVIVTQFGPAVQEAFEATFRANDKAGDGKNIQDLCNNEQVGWMDPTQPIMLSLGEGLKLYVRPHMDHTTIVIDTLRSPRKVKPISSIKFRKVYSECALHWFGFVTKPARLIINGKVYAKESDIVIGPLPPFSIVEYEDRVVFLYLNRESVEFQPDYLDLQTTVSRILGNIKNSQTSGDKGAAATTPALTRGDTVDTRIRVRIEPEIQPDDGDSCKYFAWRMREWKLLQQRFKVVLADPVLPPDANNTAAWLYDSHVYRAIASVNTAIELENKDVKFAMIDEYGFKLASRVQGADGQPLITTVRNEDLFLPYNMNPDTGNHWLLVHVKYANGRPGLHVYDSLDMARGTEGIIKKIILNTELYDIDKNKIQSPGDIELTHHTVPRQLGGWECGYLTILNAWCIALGMRPGTNAHYAASGIRVKDLIDMINLSMAGFMDSATIQAFMRCVGFVDARQNNTIAPDRHFTRSVPFVLKTSVNKYIFMRREIEENPNSNISRLDLATIRLLLQPFLLFEDVDTLSADDLLLHFDRWLKDQGLSDPTVPPSPASPATVRLTFGLAQSVPDAEGTIPDLPDDTRLLRKIWNIYHEQMKKQGHLGSARQHRAYEKANGSFCTEEIGDDIHYPYDEPKIVVLDRLGMLPTENTLTQLERDYLREGVPQPVLKLRLKHNN